MFQTELVKFLQSFSTDWLTAFLVFISELGYASFYIPVLILITLGLDLRRGFLLMQMLIWVGLLTDLLKNVFALPRPADVDSGVALLKENLANPTPLTDMGGRGFWGLPDPEAIRIIRARPDWSYGLPSGHVSGTASLWGGLSLLFRPRALKVAAVVMIVLMALSRMYLGRHFLADVLGGLVLASGILTIFFFGFVRPEAPGRILELVRLRLAADARSLLVLAFLLLAPVALLAVHPMIEAEYSGRLFGLNAAFLALAVSGLPDDFGSWSRRAARVALTFAIYLAAAWVVGRVVDAGLVDEDRAPTAFLVSAIPAFAALWGGVRAGLGLRLYSRSAE